MASLVPEIAEGGGLMSKIPGLGNLLGGKKGGQEQPDPEAPLQGSGLNPNLSADQFLHPAGV